VTVLGGPSPGARLLRPTNALDDTAGRALQRVAADVLACAAPVVVVDLSAIDTVTADGVAALIVVAETAGEADIGLAVVAGDRMRAALAENDVHDLFELYETVDEALEAM
jgi:anti-anti-sigma regulatory factor